MYIYTIKKTLNLHFNPLFFLFVEKMSKFEPNKI